MTMDFLEDEPPPRPVWLMTLADLWLMSRASGSLIAGLEDDPGR